MLNPFICAWLFISLMICYGESKLFETAEHDCDPDNSELLMASMIHRHGDRTPIEETMQYVTDKKKVRCKTKADGLGQLTKEGKRRGYKLGKYLRSRYSDLLSSHYNSSEIYIHSTDCTRTEMTVMCAMAAVYPAQKDNWSKDINWDPAPYTTYQAKDDYLYSIYNCPKFAKKFLKKLSGPVPGMEKYDSLLSKLTKIFGKDLTNKHAMLYIVHDALVSQIHLGIPVTDEVKKLMPELKESADIVVNYLLGDEEDLGFQAGVLLKQFLDAAAKTLQGKCIQKVYVHSAHDINVFPYVAASGVSPRTGVPKYTALFALELRKVKKTGRKIVCPVYLSEPGAKEQVLKIKGCVGACDLVTFRTLTAKYVMDEDERKILCGITVDFLKDLIINTELSIF